MKIFKSNLGRVPEADVGGQTMSVIDITWFPSLSLFSVFLLCLYFASI